MTFQRYSSSSLRPIILWLLAVATTSSRQGQVSARQSQQLRGPQSPQQPHERRQELEDVPSSHLSSPAEETVVEAPRGKLIPAEYAEYRKIDGEYEIVVHRVPVDTGLDTMVDPWMKMALAQGVDLNDYNVTYEGRTWETLEEDHRRNLISVNAWENNNARFCVYERNRRGIAGLSWSVDLIQQAQEQASYMAAVQHIEHRANLATGIDPGWRIIEENVCQNTNIGYYGAFTSLMNDPAHRENILNVRVAYVGIGVSVNPPYYYMCQVMKGTT